MIFNTVKIGKNKYFSTGYVKKCFVIRKSIIQVQNIEFPLLPPPLSECLSVFFLLIVGSKAFFFLSALGSKSVKLPGDRRKAERGLIDIPQPGVD